MTNPTTEDRIPTPGPWKINKYGSVGAGPYGTLPIVAYVEALEGHDRKYGDHLANARLIAAAPELLAAARSALHEMCRTTAPRDSFTDAVDQLDAAIAKAEGRS